MERIGWDFGTMSEDEIKEFLKEEISDLKIEYEEEIMEEYEDVDLFAEDEEYEEKEHKTAKY